MDTNSLEPVITFFKEFPFARPGAHDDNRYDIKYSVRPNIIWYIDQSLVASLNSTVKKKLNNALFTFYHGLFPDAIDAILKIEDRPKPKVEGDNYAKFVADLDKKYEYEEALREEFFKRMDEQTGPAIDYVTQQIVNYKIEDDKLIVDVGGLITEIQNSRRMLYKGKITLTDPELVRLHKMHDVSHSEVFAGTDYREQIIKHVSLIWRLYLVYFTVYRKEGLFTIPYKNKFKFENLRNKSDRDKLRPLIGKLTEDSYTEWLKIPLEKKIAPIGVTFKDIADKVFINHVEGDHHV